MARRWQDATIKGPVLSMSVNLSAREFAQTGLVDRVEGLLAELVQLCRLRNAGRLWLEVRESNGEARETYRRLGFAPVGRRKDYYPAPAGRREDAVVMSLDVGEARELDALD